MSRLAESTHKRILLVDDDPDQLSIRCSLLERHGFVCLQALDGISAARLAADSCPDCIVMDLRIPTERDGIALIRSAGALPDAPRIIVLTGGRASVLKKRSDLGQVAAFIEKGGPTADLVRAVTGVCA
jgi:two-component system alkaline phosphatase synthesis response regulator PhoP